jgi:hypothetical protein
MRSGIDIEPDDQTASFVDRYSRYDLQLFLVPFAFVVALLASAVFGVPTRSALGVASLVSAATVADGLFRRPPRPTAAL